MSSGSSTSPRQGVRGTGAKVMINQTSANAKLRKLMEKGTPRGGGGKYTNNQMRALAVKAGFNSKKFK